MPTGHAGEGIGPRQCGLKGATVAEPLSTAARATPGPWAGSPGSAGRVRGPSPKEASLREAWAKGPAGALGCGEAAGPGGRKLGVAFPWGPGSPRLLTGKQFPLRRRSRPGRAAPHPRPPGCWSLVGAREVPAAVPPARAPGVCSPRPHTDSEFPARVLG